MIKQTSVSLFALVLATYAQQVHAQEVAGRQASSSDEAAPSAFGDIVVTANKRSESSQKVGISISAYSGEQLAALGIKQATDITQQIPGLRLNAWSPNVTIFNLRGISQNNFTDYLEAPVAVYVDDAYMGSINGLSGQLFDTKRVEVLRGPQGTLFGRNATGGLIHYISRDASETALNGYMDLSYERFDRRALEGALGGMIVPGLRFRLAGRVVKANGYIKSADADGPGTAFKANGQDLGGENGWALRGTVQVDLGSRGTLDLWVKHSEDNHVATGGYVFDNCDILPNGYCHVNAAGLTDGAGGVINGITGAKASPWEHFSNDFGQFDRRTDVYQAKVAYKLGAIDLTSITNYTDLDKTYVEDPDALPISLVTFQTATKYKQFSQELRLAGSAGALRWQAGAYFLDMKISGRIAVGGAPALGAAQAAGFNPVVNPVATEDYVLHSRNWSVFGQAEYDLSEKVTVIAGVRYSKDTKSVDYTSTLRDGSQSVVRATDETFNAVVPGVSTIHYGDWAARVGVNYKPTPDTLIFASWNRGIKGGNFTLSPDISAQTFQHRPEVLNSIEAGIKWANTQRTLRGSLTAFQYFYKDYQTFSILNAQPQVNNSNATATGAELEVFWQPVRRVNINLGATYERSSVDNVLGANVQVGPELFPGAPDAQYCHNQNDGTFFCDFPQKTIKNAQLPNAPKLSLNYLLRYNFDTLAGNIAAQVDGVWYDKQYLEVTNGRSSLQPAYNVTNTSLTWSSQNDKVSVQVFARNVFNKAYRAYTLNLGILGTTSLFAKPATYGAAVTFKW